MPCGSLGVDRLAPLVLFTGGLRGQDHRGGGIAQHVHGGVACDRRGVERLEAPGHPLAPAVVDRQGAPVLEDAVATRATRAPLFAPEPLQRHGTEEPCRHGPRASGHVGLGQLVIQRLGGARRTTERMEPAGAIGPGLHPLAGAGRGAREAQAQGGDAALASTKLQGGAPGVQQGFGKHPLALICDHAKVSVSQLALLALLPQQHAYEECQMDRSTNPHGIKDLKVPTYEKYLPMNGP